MPDQQPTAHATPKNAVRKVNLDDIDETEGVGDLTDFDQEVKFEEITGTVPRGEYRLKNEQITLKMSKASQKPMLTIRALILSGQHEGVSIFQDFSWAEGRAQVRSKNAFVGMGMPANYQGSLRNMADEVLKDLEYYAQIDIEQSEGINDRTQQPYDPRNRIVSTSETPQTSG